ncbi:hypothetical protein [Herbaspirillum sp. YR522]|uniref:hypothetical protein n=1 Tax=Herbaspirillum sp. YR522 TaxID=1144342 RepID=UPI00026F90E4|nr:hypothetical protein [Herbaspirillum sp. YR522]EJN07988.1 hypothetical protein PMI40_01539 [Herbaspirillum sp. YR522]
MKNVSLQQVARLGGGFGGFNGPFNNHGYFYNFNVNGNLALPPQIFIGSGGAAVFGSAANVYAGSRG